MQSMVLALVSQRSGGLGHLRDGNAVDRCSSSRNSRKDPGIKESRSTKTYSTVQSDSRKDGGSGS